ncbi:MAG: sigma 54-interacting transcriptional regulator [Firmicutes bacterium]|nr:sigma 54-interacting transcriptional regulator [Bacillota bacterium]
MKKELFSIIFENFKDGFLFCDKRGKVVYANPSYCRLCNVTQAELVGQYYYNLLSSEMNLIGREALLHVYTYIERVEMVENEDDLEKKYHVTGIPLFDENNELIYVVIGAMCAGNIQNLHDYLTIEGSDNVRAAIKPLNTVLPEDGIESIVAESRSMKEAVAMALQVAPTDVSVLITGPSGTGKEVIADLIYQNSKRNGKPFIKINCAAIPANLMESELFGYAEGAFTGAMKGGKPGLFEVANGGVVFLDEIGDMPLELQPKILRLLQSHELMRVGGRDTIHLDIRLISATNANLPAAIVNKEFREDLYYRINVVPINLRPLMERVEDIEPLILHFLAEYNEIHEKKLTISGEALNLMKRYGWPGNIRELKNIVERLVVMSQSDSIDTTLIRIFLGLESMNVEEEKPGTLYSALENLEKSMISNAMQRNPSKRKAAAELGIDHSTLIKKCRKYGF